MEEIIDNDINNNKSENEILSNITKECPYCNIILSSKEYNDHILCHEIDQNENGNLSNNINGFGLKKMNNNTKSSNVFSGLFQKIDNLIKHKNNDNNENKEINNDNNINNQNNNNKFSLSSLFNRNNDSESDSDSYSDEEKIGDKFKPIFEKVANFFKRRDDNDSGSSDDESPSILRRIPFFRRRSNSENNIDYNNNEEDNSDDLLNDELFNKNESKELLKYIPTSVVSKEKKPSDNNSRCIICLSEFQVGEKESTLPCLHIFHSSCIETWINNKQWCPICKYDISLKSLLSKNNY